MVNFRAVARRCSALGAGAETSDVVFGPGVKRGVSVAEFAPKSATSAARGWGPRGAKLMTVAPFGRVAPNVLCHHECSSLLDGRPG